MLRAAASNDDALSRTSRRRTMRLIVSGVIISLILGTCCVAKLSDKRLCYDKDCSVLISEGRTTLPYPSNDPDVLSFSGGAAVKVFSKSAGSRPDLWGVEIKGKRGYVPLSFIKESKVLKKDLLHIVPVKTGTDGTVKENTPKSEIPIEIVSDTIHSPAQVDGIKGEVPKDEVSKSDLEDTISPHQVTPSFESVYDGTIIPREIDEVEPPMPSYSTQTPQNNVNAEEGVQLNFYPNILSSTFSSLSGIFSGDDESEGESEEDAESVELASSEKAQSEESTEKTPEFLEKTDETSPVTEEKPEEVSQNAVPENKIETFNTEAKVDKIVAESETDSLVQPEVKEKDEEKEISVDQIVNEEKEISQEQVVNGKKGISEEPVENKEKDLSEDQVVEEEKVISEQPDESKEKEPSEEQIVEEKKVISDQPVESKEQESSEEQVEEKKKEIGEQSVKNTGQELDKEQDVEKNVNNVELVINEQEVIIEKPIEETQIQEESVIQKQVLEVAAVVNETADVGVQTEPIKIKSDVNDVPVAVDTNKEIPFQIVVGENVDVIEQLVDGVPNEEVIYVTQNILHAEEEIVESLHAQEAIPSGQENIVDSSAFNTESNTSTQVFSEETVVDKKTDEVNDTLVNSATVEESIIPEVPSKQEAIQESVTPSNESFIPQEPSYHSNILSNDSILNHEQTLEINESLTVPHKFAEESKLVENQWTAETQQKVDEVVVDSNNNEVVDAGYSTGKLMYLQNDSAAESVDSSFQPADSSHESIVDIPSTPSFGEFLGNRNLLNAGKGFHYDDHSEEIGVDKIIIDESVHTTVPSASDESLLNAVKQEDENVSIEESPVDTNIEKIVLPMDTCDINSDCSGDTSHQYTADANAVTSARKTTEFNSETLLIVCITAVTTLLFSLGYYFLENRRRDAFLIGKINKLEANLMKTEKECLEMQEKFTFTKTKLNSIEDESFGSNEMVTSLKSELAASERTREELEGQIISLEKELESTSEAGLELERMLREILSSQSDENNPLAQSIEELQTRLNDQQVANESLKTALTVKTQENENLSGDLTVSIKKIEQLQAEVTKLARELKSEISTKNNLEETLSSKVQILELQVKTISEDKTTVRKQLKLKELEVKELLDVVEKFNSNNLDFEKVYEVSKIKAEAAQLLDERDELRTKINDEEGARQLLEEHVRLVTEEVAFLSEQCKVAEKEKQDAKTQLEVLKHFFEERETQRQREEKMWLEKQGEHSSTVERLQTMQNEILNYKQQIEMLKREILDQEKEYKNQIAALETKAHEQWVTARQNERRLEEIKAESSQLRNRLTLAEKNINDVDPESKLHRLQPQSASNGEPERGSLYPGGSLHSSGDSLDKSHHSSKV